MIAHLILGIITLCSHVVCLEFYVPTSGLNFDTLPTCDSHRYPAVTHLSNFRYSNTEKVKNRTPHESKLTFSQNLLTPIQPNKDPTQCNAMLVCVKCFFKQLSKSEATKPN